MRMRVRVEGTRGCGCGCAQASRRNVRVRVRVRVRMRASEPKERAGVSAGRLRTRASEHGRMRTRASDRTLPRVHSGRCSSSPAPTAPTHPGSDSEECGRLRTSLAQIARNAVVRRPYLPAYSRYSTAFLPISAILALSATAFLFISTTAPGKRPHFFRFQPEQRL